MPPDNTPTRSSIKDAKQPGWQRLSTDMVRRLEEAAKQRIGQTLAGRFHLKRIIAIGGMATVYEAIRSPLMRRVAVKILHPTEIEAGRTEYFLREANAAAALRHPNIISIVDFGKEDDTLFLAMEYVPGQTFGELLASEYPLPHKRLIHIIQRKAQSRDAGHAIAQPRQAHRPLVLQPLLAFRRVDHQLYSAVPNMVDNIWPPLIYLKSQLTFEAQLLQCIRCTSGGPQFKTHGHQRTRQFSKHMFVSVAQI